MSDVARPTSSWRRHPKALWRRSFDRIVVLPDGHDDLLLLEGVGAAIWQLLEHPATTDELVEPLAAHYEMDAGAVSEQVEAFITQLAADGAVQRT